MPVGGELEKKRAPAAAREGTLRRRLPLSRRSVRVSAAAGGVLVIALLAGLMPGASDGQGDHPAAHRAAPSSSHSRVAGAASFAVPGENVRGSEADVTATRTCLGAPRSGSLRGYVNPLASAAVQPRRIDQGVDYAGSGTLTAIGAGTVVEVARTDTGWPGAFIEYQLADGPAAGCFVFYAEGVIPAPALRAGQAVRAGQPIATLIPDYSAGIEIGWGSGIGTGTYAAQFGTWTSTDDEDSIPTEAGKSFSALVAALGGPPGKIAAKGSSGT